MAATAIFIHFRSNRHRRFLLHNATSTVRFYSSSDDNSHNPNSRFSDIKSTLKTTQNTRTTSFHNPIPNTNTNPKPKAASLEEISKSLSKFKRAAPVVSFQELYQRNKTPKPDTGSGSGSQGPDLQEIRRSLKGIGSNPARSQSATGLNSKLRPRNSNEMQSDSTAKGNVSNEAKTGLGRLYSYGDMGEKLRSLRPRNNKNVRFSLEELNERLQKVREMEEKDMSAGQFGPLRESLQKLSSVEQTKKKVVSISGLLLGETTRLSLEPPKEVLVEKYFHPDHMSSAEKQKLELKKVRDKFKVSESDCGSARVQEELNERLQKVQEMEEKEIAAGPIGLLSERFKKLSCGEQTKTKEGSGGCLYVKVSMDDAPYLRAIDLKTFHNYAELFKAIEKMFSCFTRESGHPSSEGIRDGSQCVLTHEDKDGDWMLVGDVPWEMFIDSCKRLRIMKTSKAIG